MTDNQSHCVDATIFGCALMCFANDFNYKLLLFQSEHELIICKIYFMNKK